LEVSASAMAEPAAKRLKAGGDVTLESLLARLDSVVVHAKADEIKGEYIATHHGTFHADEVMACAMLKCLPQFAEMPILRTRDQAEIEKAAIVVDVGGSYDETKHRYDHHQRTFTTTYSDAYPEIKLSSAGLVYKHFGGAVIEALCGKLPEAHIQAIEAKTYGSLIRELDALDNGVQIADNPRYSFVTHLGARVGRLNPSWQEERTPDIENAKFKRALRIAAEELCEIICGYATGWLPARSIVEEALSGRRAVHESGEIMKLPQFCPWQQHLFDLESEQEPNRSPLVKYVLFQDSRAGWRIQCAPEARQGFANRLSLPQAWRGVRDAELSKVSGIDCCVFVHAGGFIGGNTTEDGALKMAIKALEIAAASAGDEKPAAT